ncbi:MAG: hypothetical protein QGG98_04600 [Pseudomonadales bacterium]|jgi:hypothetical protein|nr:hypothetical protein [Pseudomonadales bacterium]|tara:strand:- start:743 stop:1084 length:342 start_codon:yes stop_codon:yes gene_type:complete
MNWDAFKNFDELDPIELRQASLLLHSNLHIYESYYLNHKSDVFDESLWKAKCFSLQITTLRANGFTDVWMQGKLAYSEEFRNLVDDLVVELESEQKDPSLTESHLKGGTGAEA